MANLVNATGIAYTPLKHPEYFFKTLKKARMIDGDFVRVLPNVTKEAHLKSLVMDGNTISQADDRNCSWNPTQRFTVEGKTASVSNYKVNEELCLTTLDALYSEELFHSKGADKTEWPSVEGEDMGLEGTVMLHLQNALANDIDKLIIGGEINEVAGSHVGLIDQILADSGTVKVSGVTIDATNVLAEVEKVYNAIPTNLIFLNEFEPERAGVRIFVDLNTMRYLRQALNTTATNYQVTLPSYTYVDGKVTYMGIEIVAVANMPANTMLAFSRDNVVFLTDLLAETAEIETAMGNTLKDKNVWYASAKYRAGVAYIWSDEMVLYHKFA